ncbi:MAG: hypothetical protein NTZ37_08260 [Methanoregula sp.]|nr:hypothetical protein [Methanoregula sp.]
MNNDRETENHGKTVPAPASGKEEATVTKNLVKSIREIIDSIEEDKIHEMNLQLALVEAIRGRE